MATQTKDSLPWKLRTGPAIADGALTTAQISSLSAKFEFSVDALLGLSYKLNIGLSEELHLAQPELHPAKIKKGVASIRRAIKEVLSAEAHLSDAADFIQEVRFRNALPGMFSLNIKPEQYQRESFVSAIESLSEFRSFLEVMAQGEFVIHTGIPDKRLLRDVRRRILCVEIFGFWDEHQRALTYTTDVATSERSGKLFTFVNAVVECLSDPPSRLNGDAIKDELEEFIASCSAEWVSERISRKIVNRPT